MKHHRSLFRALSALLCLVLCTQLTACGQKDTFSPASGKRYDDSLISEAISKEGTLTDEYDQDWDYSYHIPQLADDTADAESINKAIMNILSSDAQATLSSSSVTKMPETHYADISWQSHWNGSLLSLSLHLTGWASDIVSYEVYHYDFASGRRLTNAQRARPLRCQQGGLHCCPALCGGADLRRRLCAVGRAGAFAGRRKLWPYVH